MLYYKVISTMEKNKRRKRSGVGGDWNLKIVSENLSEKVTFEQRLDWQMVESEQAMWISMGNAFRAEWIASTNA